MWDILDETFTVCFDGKCNYSFKFDRVNLCHTTCVESKYSKEYENIILYVNTIVNYNVWKMRNLIVHEAHVFDIKKLINKIITSCRSRKSFEDTENRITLCKKVDFLQEFYLALCSIRDATYDPG